MFSMPQHLFDNDIRFISLLMNIIYALIVGLPTITKQQTKPVDTTGRTLFHLLYCLVPDFFRMSILSCPSAMSMMALSNLLCNLAFRSPSCSSFTSVGSSSRGRSSLTLILGFVFLTGFPWNCVTQWWIALNLTNYGLEIHRFKCIDWKSFERAVNSIENLKLKVHSNYSRMKFWSLNPCTLAEHLLLKPNNDTSCSKPNERATDEHYGCPFSNYPSSNLIDL